MNIVIIGNGVAGVTCALAARQRDATARITIVSGESDYFFSRTALMYAFMDRMQRRDLEPMERGVWAQQRIELKRAWATDMDSEAHTVTLDDGSKLPWDRLVFAVGAKPNLFDWQGLPAVKEGLVHFVSMQDLDHCERLVPSTKRAVVLGGGLIGIELVECLVHHGIPTTFLIREPWYWPMALGAEESTMVSAHMRKHGVDVRLTDELGSIDTDPAGRVSGVVTKRGERLPCQMLGICVGVRTNIDRIKAFGHKPEMRRGIVVNERFETSIPGVYAIGDCAEIQPTGGQPFGELIWYSAKRHGQQLGAHNLWGDAVDYRRPTFFNSSKFFEIEYTTVGRVMEMPNGTPTILLKHPKRDLSVRIVHLDGAVVGFNMLGSRWNHEVLARWVNERRSPEWAIANLAQAQYDVEFGRAPLNQLVRTDLPLHKEL